MESRRRISIIISAGACLFALAHIIVPKLAIDAITVSLLIIMIIPWLAPLLKSIELPGGLKVEFQKELQETAERAESAGLLDERVPEPRAGFSFQSINDPNLALAGLRIEIEKRLFLLAESGGIVSPYRKLGIRQLLQELTKAEVLTHEERSIISDLVNVLNSAVHGALVDPHVAKWAVNNVGPRLLASLDKHNQVK